MAKKLTTIVLDELTEAQQVAIDIVMGEGALREQERILALLEDERSNCKCEEPLQHLGLRIRKDSE
jgi:hypothetical protein